jgi:hypothetical protein
MNVRDLPGKPDREQAAKNCDLRPRMLLAFASRLQARLESEVEPELLASENED